MDFNLERDFQSSTVVYPYQESGNQTDRTAVSDSPYTHSQA
jgi:hypothetical protein